MQNNQDLDWYLAVGLMVAIGLYGFFAYREKGTTGFEVVWWLLLMAGGTALGLLWTWFGGFVVFVLVGAIRAVSRAWRRRGWRYAVKVLLAMVTVGLAPLVGQLVVWAVGEKHPHRGSGNPY